MVNTNTILIVEQLDKFYNVQKGKYMRDLIIHEHIEFIW